MRKWARDRNNHSPFSCQVAESLTMRWLPVIPPGHTTAEAGLLPVAARGVVDRWQF